MKEQFMPQVVVLFILVQNFVLLFFIPFVLSEQPAFPLYRDEIL
jgi:hypothetical protein